MCYTVGQTRYCLPIQHLYQGQLKYASMVKADKPKKEKRTAEAAADGPEKKTKKSKKEKKELPEEEADIVANGAAEPMADDVNVEEPASDKKKKKKRKSDASEVSEAAPSEPPTTEKKKKKKAKAEQTAAVPIAEAPVEGTVVVTAEDEDVDEADDDEVC